MTIFIEMLRLLLLKFNCIIKSLKCEKVTLTLTSRYSGPAPWGASIASAGDSPHKYHTNRSMDSYWLLQLFGEPFSDTATTGRWELTYLFDLSRCNDWTLWHRCELTMLRHVVRSLRGSSLFRCCIFVAI